MLAYERPVIYIDTPRKIMNKEFNDISIEPLEYKIRKEIGIIVKIEEVENITNFIDSLNLTKKKMKKNIQAMRENIFTILNNQFLKLTNYIQINYLNFLLLYPFFLRKIFLFYKIYL